MPGRFCCSRTELSSEFLQSTCVPQHHLPQSAASLVHSSRISPRETRKHVVPIPEPAPDLLQASPEASSSLLTSTLSSLAACCFKEQWCEKTGSHAERENTDWGTKLQQQQLPPYTHTHTPPPLPFPPPYHRPRFGWETPCLLLTGNRSRSRMAGEPLREGKSSSVEGSASLLGRSRGKEVGV